MNTAVRIEEKRREQLRARMAQLKAERLAAPPVQPVPVQRTHYRQAGHGTTKRDMVLDFIRDGALYSIPEIGDTLEFKQTSVAAMLRDLRKPVNGGHIIETVRIEGDHYYRYVR